MPLFRGTVAAAKIKGVYSPARKGRQKKDHAIRSCKVDCVKIFDVIVLGPYVRGANSPFNRAYLLKQLILLLSS